MNFDLTKYLGEYGAAIAAAGVAIIYYLNNRTSNNLNTKITNIESELLDVRQSLNMLEKENAKIQYEFSEYRRNHP